MLPSNIVINTVGRIYEDVVTVRCASGFRFIDGDFLKLLSCNESGEWNSTLIADCERKYM